VNYQWYIEYLVTTKDKDKEEDVWCWCASFLRKEEADTALVVRVFKNPTNQYRIVPVNNA
jgi:hypothetical protein